MPFEDDCGTYGSLSRRVAAVRHIRTLLDNLIVVASLLWRTLLMMSLSPAPPDSNFQLAMSPVAGL